MVTGTHEQQALKQELYNKIKEEITLCNNVHFIGNINSLFANSFNDNIIQALQITKIINDDYKR